MPWEKIINLPECKSVKPPGDFQELFLLKNSDDTHWLIGRYRDLTRFATALRTDETLRNVLSVNQVRIGLRKTDIPPVNVDRQKCYGTTVQAENFGKDFSVKRLCSTAQPVSELEIVAANRITDRAENIENFWASQTPQSHHIVEFNNLETLGASRRVGTNGMDYFQLPAVLLAAEFHQRYISAILKPTHHWDAVELTTKISTVYGSLYLERSKLFKPLWSVSKILLDRSGF